MMKAQDIVIVNKLTNYNCEKWLKNYGYERKNNGYILKYHKNGNIFKFGFNYYQEANNLIIETWLNVLGSEYPLTEKVYEKSICKSYFC